jgi:DNA-binding CsgD family transcriptional regulator
VTDVTAFPARLEEALGVLLRFDICMVFAYRGRSRPLPIYDNMPADLRGIVVGDYVAGPYLLDPFFEAVQAGRRSGCASLHGMAPDRFSATEYYRRHYVRTGIGDEVGVFFALPQGWTGVVSVTRTRSDRRFSRPDLRRLDGAAPMVSRLCSAHWSQILRPVLGAGTPTAVAETAAAVGERISTELDGFGSEVLTPRQAEVVGLILKGHSSEAIGQIMEISPGTVKIHRKNAYHKLGISSQSELFSLFISQLAERLETRDRTFESDVQSLDAAVRRACEDP